MDDDLPDLVVASRLETIFFPGCVQHQFHDSSSAVATRLEIWDIREEIGRGASGVVRKEELRNTQPADSKQLRAVKQMRKHQANQSQWTYRDELAAVIKFSQPDVGFFYHNN